jgi:hypothetical protein
LSNWSKLNEDNHIISKIVCNWEKLLSDSSHKEETYHRYLAEHAGFFWGNPITCHSCISKIALGSDYQTDFVLPYDDGSYGFIYEFIEIESPHSPAFTSKGTPTQRLVNSIQQIINWRDWLTSNMQETLKLFPSAMLNIYKKPRFNFSIYISRREELTKYNHLRQQQEIAHNISIRSFDKLTEYAKNRPFLDKSCLSSAQEKHLADSIRTEIANPFYQSMSGKEWKELVTNKKFDYSHMYVNNAELFINARTYNSHLESFTKDNES